MLNLKVVNRCRNVECTARDPNIPTLTTDQMIMVIMSQFVLGFISKKNVLTNSALLFKFLQRTVDARFIVLFAIF